ncbi:hypothetical protein [Spiroplasma alleghenense]|uniref:Uncharacterized protein n=1 Tax=Spiroplasma alleghenense TaxID=216931 RepID=A0A345Z322_9MOLU|nr:hypothetical protein [Spiroplasma alleghenense]AXK51001.1 hypothetical protein SALLE_v1c03270 [Spiroplasma alleghenense]
MQNELKIVKNESNLNNLRVQKPGKAYFKFILRISKRQKFFLIAYFFVGLVMSCLLPLFYQISFNGFVKDREQFLVISRLIFLIMSILTSITLIGGFFQKIFFENRNTVVFKRVALTQISKKKFLFISAAIMFSYSLVVYILSTITFLIGSSIFIDNGFARVIGSWFFLRDFLIYLASCISFVAFLFIVFSLTYSVTIAKLMSIPYILFNTVIAVLVLANLDVKPDLLNLIMLIYLLILVILSVLFWLLAFKKFRFHF